jgi:formate dehydrogenase major subunit
MNMVNITINGQKISAQMGITILQAARQAGVDIPTLCDHPALSPAGACRMCIVEVAGQRTPQTACTFPITEGMEIQTESPLVVKARKLVLDMLFSERNHFCPYCEASGNCELQSLGYRFKLDHWVFPTYTKRFPVDGSHKYYMMDHNRCILCGRCIRACDDIAANHTLGLRQRGSESMIHADANVPLGESTCISCGTCMQVCPTGALSNRRSAFMGRDDQVQNVKSICSQCSVGCGMQIVARNGNVLRLDSDFDAPVGHGLLCIHGRFEPLYDERRRLTKPMLRSNGELVPISWEKAAEILAGQVGTTAAKEAGLLISSNATNEAFYVIDKLFRKELQIDNIGLFNKTAPKIFLKPQGKLDDIMISDIILVIGANPVQDQPVAAYIVKRAVDHGSRLVVVDGKENELAPFAFMNLGYNEIETAIDIAGRAERPMVLYGSDITAEAIEALKKIKDKAAFIALDPGVNTRAAAALGLNKGLDVSAVKFLYIIAGEENNSGTGLMKNIPKKAFVAVQSSFFSALTDRADLVLPAAVWSERSGSLTNMEGRVQKVVKAVEPLGEAKPDWEILSLLADKLGKKNTISVGEAADQIAQLLK